MIFRPIEDGGDELPVEAFDEGGNLLHLLAQRGAEALEIRLRAIADQGRLILLDDHILDVELLGDDLGHLGEDCTLFAVAVHQVEGGEWLADLEVVGCPQCTPHGDGTLGEAHALLQLQVAFARIVDRVVAVVHALRHLRGAEVLEDLLRREGDDGGGDLDEGHQDPIEGVVGLFLVGVALTAPETATAAADVPVVQIVDERHEVGTGALDVVPIEGGGDGVDERLARADDPAIERILKLVERRLGGLIAVEVGIGDEE